MNNFCSSLEITMKYIWRVFKIINLPVLYYFLSAAELLCRVFWTEGIKFKFKYILMQ